MTSGRPACRLWRPSRAVGDQPVWADSPRRPEEMWRIRRHATPCPAACTQTFLVSFSTHTLSLRSESSDSCCKRRPPFLSPTRQPTPPPSQSSRKPILQTLSLPACAAPCLRAGSTVGRRAALWPGLRLAGSWIAKGLATAGCRPAMQRCTVLERNRT